MTMQEVVQIAVTIINAEMEIHKNQPSKSVFWINVI